MKAIGKFEFVALVAALMMVDALAIDIMLPALPDIGNAFGVERENDRSLVLAAFTIGFGLPQIIFGPLSDRFGRRIPILGGLAVYILCAAGAVFAPSFAILLALRFLQGVGGAAVRVGLTAAVRDNYSGTEMARIMSLVFAIFLLVPVVMPAAGQLLLIFGSWQFIFLVMAGIAALNWLWGFARLRESLAPEDRRALNFASVVEGFALVFTNRRALFYGGSGAFLLGGVLSMVFSSQQVFVDIYGFGDWYPLSMVIIGGSAALSSLAASRVLPIVGLRRTAHIAALSLPVIAFAFAILAATVGLPAWAYLLATVLFAPCFIGGFSSSGALSMEPLGAVAGTASAVFGLITSVFGAILATLIVQTFNGTVVPILIGIGIMGCCVLASFTIAEKGRLFGRDQAPLSPASAEAF
jgi:DHA1 family bicyclomycin/chloramphenicol resistance-like MFS transporter